MVSGAADTPTVSVVGYNVVPYYRLDAIHIAWSTILDFRHVVTVTSHTFFDFGSITDSNEDSCLRCQLVYICSLVTEFDEVTCAHKFLQGCGQAWMWPLQCQTYMIPYRTQPGRIQQVDIWLCACVSVLFRGYDRYPSTWALDADIHGHPFLDIKVNQQDKTSVSLHTTLMYESSLASDAILTK